jgi:hypothetical protein
MRFALALVVATLLAGIVAPNASALRFSDTPCVEPRGRQIRVCPAGIVGTPYAIKLTGEGGCGPDPNVPGSGLPYQYRLLNGTLPPGLVLTKDGVLSGVPTHAGSWSFWIELSDQDPPSAAWCRPTKSEREFTLQVGAAPGEVGAPYALALGAPGDAPQTWSIISGRAPPGLALDPAGAITGTPEVAGSFPLAVSVVDSKGRVERMEFAINISPRLVLMTRTLPVARAGRTFGARVRTTGGVGRVTFRVVSGRFPVGVRLLTKSGRIHGQPRTAGVYRIMIEGRDALGVSVRRAFVLIVRRAL